jgi:hypothetical protein
VSHDTLLLSGSFKPPFRQLILSSNGTYGAFVGANKPSVGVHETLVGINESLVGTNRTFVSFNAHFVGANGTFVESNASLVDANEPSVGANVSLVGTSRTFVGADKLTPQLFLRKFGVPESRFRPARPSGGTARPREPITQQLSDTLGGTGRNPEPPGPFPGDSNDVPAQFEMRAYRDWANNFFYATSRLG